jgi:hypothetical protein
MRLLISLLATLVVGCAQDVRVRFPSPPEDISGTLVLQLAESASDVSVALNGMLVVDNVHTQRIVISGVPIGTADVVMAANGVDKEFHVWVGAEHATTVPLGVPDASSGFIKSLFGSVLTIVIYSLLHR